MLGAVVRTSSRPLQVRANTPVAPLALSIQPALSRDIGTRSEPFPAAANPSPLSHYRKLTEDLQQSRRALSRLQRENESLQVRNNELAREHQTLKRQHDSLRHDYESLQQEHSDSRLEGFRLLSESDRKLEVAQQEAIQAQKNLDAAASHAADAEASVAGMRHDLEQAQHHEQQLKQSLDAAMLRTAEAEQNAAVLQREVAKARTVVADVCGERERDFSRSMDLASRLTRQLSNTGSGPQSPGGSSAALDSMPEPVDGAELLAQRPSVVGTADDLACLPADVCARPDRGPPLGSDASSSRGKYRHGVYLERGLVDLADLAPQLADTNREQVASMEQPALGEGVCVEEMRGEVERQGEHDEARAPAEVRGLTRHVPRFGRRSLHGRKVSVE